MKKKGLIISTVVMVVVLIASLTTATYAWFTTSDVTEIYGFNVEVVASNAVNIGLKQDCTYAEGAIESAFVTGDCTYTAGTSGVLGGGTWSGDQEGLSATLNHNITWGEQQKAVGVTTASSATEATLANTGLWTQTGGVNAVAANMVKNDSGSNVLGNQSLAVANTDYAYFFLGASPTKDLTSSELVIMVDTNGSTNVGIMAALHVAYRLNSNGDWTDVAIYGDDDAESGSIHYGQKTSALTSNLTDTQKATYKATYGSDAPTTGVRQIAINLSALKKDVIDQIEIVIYIAGDDDDCIDAAKGSKGQITMFFNVVAATASPEA